MALSFQAGHQIRAISLVLHPSVAQPGMRNNVLVYFREGKLDGDEFAIPISLQRPGKLPQGIMHTLLDLLQITNTYLNKRSKAAAS
jgi:hypothetical protein